MTDLKQGRKNRESDRAISEDAMDPTPEHLSLLAATLSREGMRAEDAVKQALRLFDMAQLQFANRKGERDPSFQAIGVLLRDVLPPEKRISVEEAFETAGKERYNTIKGFCRALEKYNLLLTYVPERAGRQPPETSILAVQLMFALEDKRNRALDRRRKQRVKEDLKKNRAGDQATKTGDPKAKSGTRKQKAGT